VSEDIDAASIIIGCMPAMAILVGCMARAHRYRARFDPTLHLRGEAGAGFCPLRTHGADATSDNALKI